MILRNRVYSFRKSSKVAGDGECLAYRTYRTYRTYIFPNLKHLLAFDLNDFPDTHISGGVGGEDGDGVLAFFEGGLEAPFGGASGRLPRAGADTELDPGDAVRISGSAFKGDVLFHGRGGFSLKG